MKKKRQPSGSGAASRDLSRWWERTPDEQEPTPAQLREAFEGIPEDPRTGYPAGYLSFAAELESRQPAQEGEWRDFTLADGTVQRVFVHKLPTAWANGASRQLHGRKRNHLRA